MFVVDVFLLLDGQISLLRGIPPRLRGLHVPVVRVAVLGYRFIPGEKKMIFLKLVYNIPDICIPPINMKTVKVKIVPFVLVTSNFCTIPIIYRSSVQNISSFSFRGK